MTVPPLARAVQLGAPMVCVMRDPLRPAMGTLPAHIKRRSVPHHQLGIECSGP